MISERELEKAWKYVGRFMWAFTIFEISVDELFSKLFNLSASAHLMLVPQLDTRKKIKLVELGLNRQGIDIKATEKRAQQLHDMRNIVAHSPFTAEDDGVDFEHVNKSAGVTNKLILYNEFDAIHEEFRDLWDLIARISSSCVPIVDVDNDFQNEIAEEMGLPKNVIAFPRRRDETD